jgi:hypothetical protein
MHAPDDSTTPSRTGIMRLITPWEYRHIHAVASLRLAGGGFDLALGLVLVSLGRKAGTDRERRKCFGLAALFLTQAVLALFGGCLDMAVIRSRTPRT